MIPKIIPRYILQEFLGVVLGSAVVFTFVLLLEKLVDAMGILLGKGVGLWEFCTLLMLLVVPLLSLTVPMAFLLASLISYGRLSEQGEIMALRAAGCSFSSFLWPPLALGIVTCLLMLPLNHTVTPRFQRLFRDTYERLLKTTSLTNLEAKTFYEIGDSRIYVDRLDKKSQVLYAVNIYKSNPQGLPLHIFAKQARATTLSEGTVSLVLTDGFIEQSDSQNPRKISYSVFTQYTINLASQDSGSVRRFRLRELTTPEIRQGLSGFIQNDIKAEIVATEIAKRTALAFSPLVVLLVGLPLGIVLERGGRGIGFGVSLFVIVIYYCLLLAGITIAQKGALPAPLALWIPNAVTALVGLALLKQLGTR